MVYSIQYIPTYIRDLLTIKTYNGTMCVNNSICCKSPVLYWRNYNKHSNYKKNRWIVVDYFPVGSDLKRQLILIVLILILSITLSLYQFSNLHASSVTITFC